MTLVNHETGEIIDTIDADEARRLTDAAQHEFRSSREHFDRAWSLIEQAVEGGGHIALGYRSPGDYLNAEFEGVLAGLDVTERRLAVRTMTDWGLSTRAIAPVVGVGQRTVVRDIAGESYGSPAPNSAPGPTSKVSSESTLEAESQQEQEGGSTDAASKPVTDGTAPAAPLAPVVGIDGKTYSRPAAPVQQPAPTSRRRPLPDAFKDAVYDVEKRMESIVRLVSDDRWPKNAEEVAARNRHYLIRINDLLQQVINSLPENEVTP